MLILFTSNILLLAEKCTKKLQPKGVDAMSQDFVAPAQGKGDPESFISSDVK